MYSPPPDHSIFHLMSALQPLYLPPHQAARSSRQQMNAVATMWQQRGPISSPGAKPAALPGRTVTVADSTADEEEEFVWTVDPLLMMSTVNVRPPPAAPAPAAAAATDAAADCVPSPFPITHPGWCTRRQSTIHPTPCVGSGRVHQSLLPRRASLPPPPLFLRSSPAPSLLPLGLPILRAAPLRPLHIQSQPPPVCAAAASRGGQAVGGERWCSRGGG